MTQLGLQRRADWELHLSAAEKTEIQRQLPNLIMLTYWHQIKARCDLCDRDSQCDLRVMRLSTGIEVADLACGECRNAFGESIGGKLIFSRQHGAISDALGAAARQSADDRQVEAVIHLKSQQARIAHERATPKPPAPKPGLLGRIVLSLKRFIRPA